MVLQLEEPRMIGDADSDSSETLTLKTEAFPVIPLVAAALKVAAVAANRLPMRSLGPGQLDFFYLPLGSSKLHPEPNWTPLNHQTICRGSATGCITMTLPVRSCAMARTKHRFFQY